MLVRAELCCYHCGYIAAGVREEPGKLVRLIPPASGPGVRFGSSHVPRCGRCGGPLYLDGIETVPEEVASASGISHAAA